VSDDERAIMDGEPKAAAMIDLLSPHRWASLKACGGGEGRRVTPHRRS
jgi:hypothetical protein